MAFPKGIVKGLSKKTKYSQIGHYLDEIFTNQYYRVIKAGVLHIISKLDVLRLV
jgi:hypothetical protein